MKRLPSIIATAITIIAVSFSCGCVPNSVKKEAEENKQKYEEAFRRKVEQEFGPDYTLHDIEGRILDYNGAVAVFSPNGSVSRGSRYAADDVLLGKVDHNGETYDVQYNFLDDTIDTNAFYPEIACDYAANLGLDTDKIIYATVNDSNFENFVIDSEIRTADELFTRFKGFGWFMVIITEEDLSDRNFDDFEPQCHENEITYGFTVTIYSSDNITNLDDLKEHYKDIRWSDPIVFNNRQPYVAYVPDAESNIFDRYNLKNAVRIGYPAEHRQVEIYKF